MAPGIFLVERFGYLKTGIWLFRNGSECMILEMPDLNEDDPFISWEQIAHYIKNQGISLKFMTATHNHGDHFNTVPQFYSQFPQSPIVVNSFFFKRANLQNFITSQQLESKNFPHASIVNNGVLIFCFQDEIFKTNLDGEPLFLIRAPKHSWSDTLIIFRGTMISGDWWLGPGDPNKNRIPESIVDESINRVIEFINNTGYIIKNVFSVHANEFRRDIDIIDLLKESRI